MTLVHFSSLKSVRFNARAKLFHIKHRSAQVIELKETSFHDDRQCETTVQCDPLDRREAI